MKEQKKYKVNKPTNNGRRIIHKPEHYFNRYIACEIRNDGKRAKKIRDNECSFSDLPQEKFIAAISCNSNGEQFEQVGDLLDSIESENLHQLLCGLSEEQILLLELAYRYCLTQCEIAYVLGHTQQNVSKSLKTIHRLIKNNLKYF